MSINRSANQTAHQASQQRPKARKSHTGPRLICKKCKDPADPMERIERKGLLKLIPFAKRYVCTRCGRERSRIFGINC